MSVETVCYYYFSIHIILPKRNKCKALWEQNGKRSIHVKTHSCR